MPPPHAPHRRPTTSLLHSPPTPLRFLAAFTNSNVPFTPFSFLPAPHPPVPRVSLPPPSSPPSATSHLGPHVRGERMFGSEARRRMIAVMPCKTVTEDTAQQQLPHRLTHGPSPSHCPRALASPLLCSGIRRTRCGLGTSHAGLVVDYVQLPSAFSCVRPCLHLHPQHSQCVPCPYNVVHDSAACCLHCTPAPLTSSALLHVLHAPDFCLSLDLGTIHSHRCPVAPLPRYLVPPRLVSSFVRLVPLRWLFQNSSPLALLGPPCCIARPFHQFLGSLMDLLL
mmetsp:Transcript_12716/g.21924  ORF Transcript_12716/g.21924 Transcript_12716/m.21924 type:complete len:281 (+) Transcript_12716:208-1050(+)